ncbi:MAG: hypothetical protein Q8O70_13100, partial [Burkholderiales bacterium]|nr:hypothetical protein [Burkholderiales bacterium]
MAGAKARATPAAVDLRRVTDFAPGSQSHGSSCTRINTSRRCLFQSGILDQKNRCQPEKYEKSAAVGDRGNQY